ncbi:MAG: hypothetical protein WD182_07925 [Bacteroidota bacterium]
MYVMDAFEEVIRTRVCVRCIERTGIGICGMGKSDECPLNQHMTGIMKAVKSVTTGIPEEYLAALHLEICGQSKEIPATSAILEEELMVALDNHLPLIMEAIDETNRRRKQRPL